MRLQIRGKELKDMGFPGDRCISIAIGELHEHFRHEQKEEALALLAKVVPDPHLFLDHPQVCKTARAILDFYRKQLARGLDASAVSAEILAHLRSESNEQFLRDEQLPCAVFGPEGIEEGAHRQMHTAMRLPVTVAGALMPDAHQGYGLPIGGVLATRKAVIPYGVGVDIGCRMCLTIFDMPGEELSRRHDTLKKVLEESTLFGAGREFRDTWDHEVNDRKEFEENKILKALQYKASRQLGSSGSGNHFVEFGLLRLNESHTGWNLEPGEYVALLSHSGSRGLGATIANHYTRLAKQLCKLPQEAQNLAWLDLDSEAGQEYWMAMNLAGDYASACHEVIHEKVARALKLERAAVVENHHNFAWKEMHLGEELIVHRKGATPAGPGVLGIIPGSMTAPGFIVRGRGETTSLHSASHGAGRQMSRTQAMNQVTAKELRQHLKQHGVTLIGGGLDEAPFAYKDINEVMGRQSELVDIMGAFLPKIVRMDGDGKETGKDE